MKSALFIIFVVFILPACTNTSVLSNDEQTQLRELRAEIEAIREEKKIVELKLQEEMQRADAQLFLVRQELFGLRRQLAAVRQRCGENCADIQ